MHLLALLILILSLLACSTDSKRTTPGVIESAGDENSPIDQAQATDDYLDIQGHRGARGLKPENTLPGFEVALDLEVTTLELDMHFTRDNIVVIWHDDRIKKEKCHLKDSAANAPDPESSIDSSELLISNLTLQQIKAYQCNLNPDDALFPEQDDEPTRLAAGNYAIPALEELFEFVVQYGSSNRKSDSQRTNASNVRFNIETKRRPTKPEVINDGFDGVNPGAFELEVLRLVAQYDLQQRVSIQSFDHRSLWSIASVDPSMTLVALTFREMPDLHEIATQGASVWSPNYQILDKSTVDLAHKAGLKVIPWTINEPSEMDVLIEFGVDGLITDRPDLAITLQE